MKIGFIDYYLDEWHANNYPEWIKEASGGEMTVGYAFAETASPHRQACRLTPPESSSHSRKNSRNTSLPPLPHTKKSAEQVDGIPPSGGSRTLVQHIRFPLIVKNHTITENILTGYWRAVNCPAAWIPANRKKIIHKSDGLFCGNLFKYGTFP